MTNYMNYIKNIINTETEMDKDSIEKLVKIAYYMGREEAAREVSDKYNDHIAEQKQRASECRYHNMAAEIIGVCAGTIGEGLYNAKIYFETAELFAWTAAVVLLSVLAERVVLALLDALTKGKGAVS